MNESEAKDDACADNTAHQQPRGIFQSTHRIKDLRRWIGCLLVNTRGLLKRLKTPCHATYRLC